MSKIDIIQTTKGRSTVTQEFIPKGKVVLDVKGEKTTERNRYSIQIGENEHINPELDGGKYMNHSCDPNCEMNEDLQMVALNDINAGDELTFDYTTTESEIIAPFDCKCGSAQCRGRIGGESK